MASHAAAAAADNLAAACETRAADMRASGSAEQLASLPAHSVVAASGGSVTTSREPPGEWTKSTDSQHPAAEAVQAPMSTGASKPKATPARAAKPASQFAAVSMATRIPEIAKWIAARPSFTFAEAAAASAPSPCSPTVMAYTLPDARLTSALAELGYVMTAGGKNGHTVTAIKAPAKPKAARAAKATTSAAS